MPVKSGIREPGRRTAERRRKTHQMGGVRHDVRIPRRPEARAAGWNNLDALSRESAVIDTQPGYRRKEEKNEYLETD